MYFDDTFILQFAQAIVPSYSNTIPGAVVKVLCRHGQCPP